MFGKLISYLTWVIFGTGFILTGVVATAQNSLPGDATYPIKIKFEKIVLAGYKLVNKDTDYQIDLTKLRFKETQQIIKTAKADAGFESLNLQILTTQQEIINVKNPTEKATYAQKYISTLKDIKTQLDYEKISLVKQTNTSTFIGISSNPSTQTTSQTTSTTNTQNQIDNTQNQIDNIINNLENSIPTINNDSTASGISPVPTVTPIPTINTTDTTTTNNPIKPTGSTFSQPAGETDGNDDVTPTPLFIIKNSPTPTSTSPTSIPKKTPIPTSIMISQ
jgi:hypothetical protein